MAKLSIRIDLAPDIRIGPGKVQLLELIAETGSISAAGRALEMSYRRAWLLIDEMNRTLPTPVVQAKPGGRSGGGASLTPFGERLVVCYRRIENEAEAGALARLSEIMDLSGDRPRAREETS